MKKRDHVVAVVVVITVKVLVYTQTTRFNEIT